MSGAILLAGGRASRMGGVDKPGLPVGGLSLRDRAIAAVRAGGATTVVVAGPRPDDADAGVRWVREDPPFTGPAAALVAGLAALDGAPEEIFVLACDLAAPDRAVALLAAQRMPDDADGLCLSDAGGHHQWLTARYRTAALRTAVSAAADAGRDLSMRALLTPLRLAAVADADGAGADIDTWDDYERATEETS